VFLSAFKGPIDYAIMRPGEATLYITSYDQALDLSLIPEQITELHLVECGSLSALAALNAGVNSLYISRCPNLHNLDGYVASLLAHQGSLSDSLTSLDVQNFGALSWDTSRLPRKLRYLSIRNGFGIAEMRNLPVTLEELYLIKVEPVAELDALPEKLKRLSLSGLSQLSDLSMLPQELQSLYINGCPKVETLPFRHSLTALTLRHHVTLSVHTPDGQDVIEDRQVSMTTEYVALLKEYDEHVISRKKRALAA